MNPATYRLAFIVATLILLYVMVIDPAVQAMTENTLRDAFG